jgi:hypothetical protein
MRNKWKYTSTPLYFTACSSVKYEGNITRVLHRSYHVVSTDWMITEKDKWNNYTYPNSSGINCDMKLISKHLGQNNGFNGRDWYRPPTERTSESVAFEVTVSVKLIDRS